MKVGVQLLITVDIVILCELYLNLFQNFFFLCFAGNFVWNLWCETCGSHSGDCEYYLLGCDAM